MIVTRVDFWNIKPGRQADALEHFQRGKAAIERNGFTNVRLRRVITGELSGLHYALADFDSLSDYGRALDRNMQDDALRAVVASGQAEDSPVLYRGNWVLSEMARFGTPAGNERAYLVQNWDVKPDRVEDFLSIAEQVSHHIQNHGGSSQIMRVAFAGNLTGGVTTAAAFPNLESLYSFAQEMATTPDGMALLARTAGDDAPATRRTMDVALDVPL
jgi:hypothetical protein